MSSDIHKRSLKKVLRLEVRGTVRETGAHQTLQLWTVYSIKSNKIVFIMMQKWQVYLRFT